MGDTVDYEFCYMLINTFPSTAAAQHTYYFTRTGMREKHSVHLYQNILISWVNCTTRPANKSKGIIASAVHRTEVQPGDRKLYRWSNLSIKCLLIVVLFLPEFWIWEFHIYKTELSYVRGSSVNINFVYASYSLCARATDDFRGQILGCLSLDS